MSTSLTNALWMRPYDEIDTSVPDLGVDVLPGRLAALSHPLNKGREILYADRETRDPDVCTVTSSGIRWFGPGGVDTPTSRVEGSIGALPRRLMVLDGDLSRARHVLETAGESFDL